MSVAELLSNEVKPWANIYVNSIDLNNAPSGLTGASIDTYSVFLTSLSSTGATGGLSLPVKLIRLGHLVNLSWTSTNFTAGATGNLIFQLPNTGYYPPNFLDVPTLVSNAGATATFGYCQVSSSGVLSFASDAAGDGFNTGGTSSVFGNGVSYYAT